MISNMQYPREMYGKGGLTSLAEARNLLEKYALPGETLAYINNDEAKYLRYMGGAGIPINSSGIPSYFSLKKLFKPVAKVLNKIVPDFIKPALPFLAAAVPVFGPAMSATLAAMTPFQLAAVSAGANLASQLSQKGAAERGINPLSLGLSALGGYAAGAGGAGPSGVAGGNLADITAGRIVGNVPMSAINPELASFGNLATQSVPFTGSQLANLSLPVSSNANSLLEAYGGTAPTLTQQAQNLGIGASEFLGKITQPQVENLQGIMNKPLSSATTGELASAAKFALPGQAMAVGDLAYNKALDALDEYNRQQAELGAIGVASTEGRKAAIRKAMGLSGYTTDEIENTLLKFNFANGGRVGYQMGGGTKPPSMPMNPDMLAMALFGKSYDQLTYTQKTAIDDMLVTKKAQGGIMDLGGNEMDLRAKGGFVPIGKKEKADDVPARLSKNEFVFTANAVRGAGKGDIKKGAKKMYQLMRQYEAMA